MSAGTPPTSPRSTRKSLVPPLDLTKVTKPSTEAPLRTRKATTTTTTTSEVTRRDHERRPLPKKLQLYNREAEVARKDSSNLETTVDLKLQDIDKKTGLERAKAILDLGRNVILGEKNTLDEKSISKIIDQIPAWASDKDSWEVRMDALWLMDVLREEGYLDKYGLTKLKDKVELHLKNNPESDPKVNENARRLINNLNFFEDYYAPAPTEPKTTERQNKLEEDLHKAQEELKAKDAEIEKIKEQNKQVLNEIESLKQDNGIDSRGITMWRGLFEEQRTKLTELENQLSTYKNDTPDFQQTYISGLKGKIEEQNKKIEKSQREIEALHNELTNERADSGELSDNVVRLTERNKELNAKYLETIKIGASTMLRADKAIKENERLNEVNAHNSTLIKQSELTIEKLKEENQLQQNSFKEELEAKQTELETKETTNTQLQADLTKITQEKQQADQKNRELEKKNRELRTTHKLNRGINTENTNLKKKLTELNANETKNETIIETLQKDNDRLKSQSQKDLEKKEATNARLQTNLATITEENKKLKENNKSLTTSNKGYAELREKHEALEQKFHILNQEAEKYTAGYKQLFEERAQLKTQQTELEQQNKTNETTLQALRAENQKLQKQIEEQQKALDTSKKEKEVLTGTNKVRDALNEKLNKETKSLKDQLEKITIANNKELEKTTARAKAAEERYHELETKATLHFETLQKTNQDLTNQLTQQATTHAKELQQLQAQQQADLKRKTKEIQAQVSKEHAQTLTAEQQKIIKQKDQEISTLQNQLQNQQKDLTKLQQAQQQLVTEANTQLHTLQQANQHLTNQLTQQATDHTEQLQQLRAQQEKELQNASEAIKAQAYTDAQAFVDQKLTEGAQALTAEQQRILAQKDQEIAALRNQVHVQQNNIAQSQQARQQLEAEANTTIQKQQEQLNQLQATIQQGTQELNELQNQLQQSQRQNEAAGRQIQDQAQALQNAGAQNAAFQAELNQRDQILQELRNDATKTAIDQADEFSKLGNYQAALKSIDRALSLQGNVDNELTRKIIVNKINTLLEAGQYPEALALADQLSQAPGLSLEIQAMLWSNKARAHNGLGNYKQALESLQGPLANMNQINDDRHKALIISEEARAFSGRGQYREAIDTLNQISDAVLYNLPPATQASIIANRTRALNGLGHYREALNLTSEALQRLEIDKVAKAELLLQRASALNALGQYHQAGITATEGLSSLGTLTTPNLNAELLLEQAQAHFNLGNNIAAFDILDRLTQAILNQNFPANHEVTAAACSLLAKVLIKKNDFAGALHVVESGLKIPNISNFSQATLLADRSSAYMSLSTPEAAKEAIKAVEGALQLQNLSNNQKALLLSDLSNIYFQHKIYPGAIHYAREGFRNAETNDVKATLACNLCNALIGDGNNLNDIQEAEKIAREALTLGDISDSQKGDLIGVLAMALTHDSNGYELAANAIIQGINNLEIHNPNVKADLYRSLGQTFNAMGNPENPHAYQLARIAALQGLAIESLDAFSYASLQHVLAEAYLGLGQFGDAYNAAKAGVEAKCDSDMLNLQLYAIAIEAKLRMHQRSDAVALAKEASEKYSNGEKEIWDYIHSLFE